MLFSRCKPLDVNAEKFRGTQHEAIYEATTRLLEDATKKRRHAAAVIRHALTEQEVDALATSDPRTTEGVQMATFLSPLNAALQDWWAKQAESATYRVKELEPYPFESHLTNGIGWHIDQKKGVWAPEFGPIAVSATLRGTSIYHFESTRLTPFDDEDAKKIGEHLQEGVLPIPADTTTITATAGDLAIWTNIPVTWHAVEASSDRMAAVYGCDVGMRPDAPLFSE